MSVAGIGVIVLLLYQVYRAARLLLQVLHFEPSAQAADLRLPEDISHLELPPPAELQSLVAELRRLGFSRVGEVQLKIRASRSGLVTWVFSDSTHEVTAELFAPVEVDFPPVVGFGTMFGETGEAYVLTHFNEPYPEALRTIIDTDFRATNVTTSLVDALAAHQRHVDELRARFGAPYPARSIKDYLDRCHVYVARFFPRRRAGSRYSAGVDRANRLLAAELTTTILLLAAVLLISSPAVNWLLMAAFVAVFLGFELSISRHWKRLLRTGADGQSTLA